VLAGFIAVSTLFVCPFPLLAMQGSSAALVSAGKNIPGAVILASLTTLPNSRITLTDYPTQLPEHMEVKMNVVTSPTSSHIQSPILAILVGGVVAGTLDATTAFITFGWGMTRGIASGVLGARAATGGTAVWLLGLALHFFIAISAAAIYYLASRRLTFLRDHFIVCGFFYGIAIFLVMNLIVVPLSAVPFAVGPFSVKALRQGLLVHMILIGLPISASVRIFTKAS
jgi:hypothetical protein